MNILNSVKLQIKYPDLAKLDINSELLEKAMSDKNFSKLYKKEIKPFIKYLYNYSYTAYDYNNNKTKQEKLDNKTISQHINSALKTCKENNKYISFVKDNMFETYKFENAEVLNDINFDTLFNLIGNRIFTNNIADIIGKGYSQRLLSFIKSNPRFHLELASANLFDDNVWNIINSNPSFGDTTMLELFGNNKNKLNTLIKIINTGRFEGFKYTYNNIPESQGFIISMLAGSDDILSSELFDTNFINTMGCDVLNKLYHGGCFSDKKTFSKIFKIYEAGNSELIEDIVNYDKYNHGTHLGNINDKDIAKNVLNMNIEDYDKKELLLNKFLGVERNENYYIKLFPLN